MQVESKYEHWRAITESDFVTLFIKTWFTFIAVLREQNPDIEVFTEDGKARGDKPFLNAYKESLMPFVQKNINEDDFAQKLFAMYPISMQKIMRVFPQYFFQTFFQINREFSYEEKFIELEKAGNIKERYHVNLHIVDKHMLKINIGMSGKFRSTNYNERIKKEIDLRPIIRATVEKYSAPLPTINEISFMRDFYNGVLDEVSKILQQYTSEVLPKKGFNKTVARKLHEACLRVRTDLRLSFDNNYRHFHDVNLIYNRNSYAIIYQVPFNGFSRVYQENIYSSHRTEYSRLIATTGVEWFADYVYALRNALFHEIIDPLDEEWQIIFKNAYLALKEIVDLCIAHLQESSKISV